MYIEGGDGSKPKELLQTCIRPVLLHLRVYTRLSVPLLHTSNLIMFQHPPNHIDVSSYPTDVECFVHEMIGRFALGRLDEQVLECRFREFWQRISIGLPPTANKKHDIRSYINSRISQSSSRIVHSLIGPSLFKCFYSQPPTSFIDVTSLPDIEFFLLEMIGRFALCNFSADILECRFAEYWNALLLRFTPMSMKYHNKQKKALWDYIGRRIPKPSTGVTRQLFYGMPSLAVTAPQLSESTTSFTCESYNSLPYYGMPTQAATSPQLSLALPTAPEIARELVARQYLSLPSHACRNPNHTNFYESYKYAYNSSNIEKQPIAQSARKSPPAPSARKPPPSHQSTQYATLGPSTKKVPPAQSTTKAPPAQSRQSFYGMPALAVTAPQLSESK